MSSPLLASPVSPPRSRSPRDWELTQNSIKAHSPVGRLPCWRATAAAQERSRHEGGPDETALLAHFAADEEAALELLATEFHARLWRYLARHPGADMGPVEDELDEESTWQSGTMRAPTTYH